MKKILCSVVMITLLQLTYGQTNRLNLRNVNNNELNKKNPNNTSVQFSGWSLLPHFPGTARDGAVGFSINGKGYVGTGFTGGFLKDFWELDTADYTWTQKADFGGTARAGAVGFAIGNKGYIGTGNGKKDFWEYDPALNQWMKKADFGGDGRSNAVGFSIGNKGYIGTGEGWNVFNDFWEYNQMTDTWTRKANVMMYSGIFGAVGFAIADKGYIATGESYYGFQNNYLKEYNPQNDTWTYKADLPGDGRVGAFCFSIGNNGYVGMGYTKSYGGNYLFDFYGYDPLTDTWATLNTSWGDPITGAVGLSIGTNGYYLFGFGDYGDTRDFWKFISTYSPCSIRSIYTKTDATCNGINNGTITVKGRGGIPPYTYRLGTTQPFDVTNTFTNLRPGKYTVSIIDAEGCTGRTEQITIGMSAPLSVSAINTDPTCRGNANGFIAINAVGGTPPFLYKIRSTGIYQSNNIINGLKAGIYRAYVKDSNDCTSSLGITVNDPSNYCPPPPGFCQDSGSSTSCLSPSNLTVNPTQDGGAFLYGDAGHAASFQIYIADQNYNKKKDTLITNILSNQQGYRVRRYSLPNGLYHWKMRSVCRTPYLTYSKWICGPDFTIPTTNGIATAKQIRLENTSSFDMNILPNPSNREFNVRIKATRQDAVSIRVLDMNGRSLYSTKGSPQQTYRFGETFAPGVYMIEVRQGDEVKTLKVVKVR